MKYSIVKLILVFGLYSYIDIFIKTKLIKQNLSREKFKRNFDKKF